jgi:Yip1-like protein
MGTVETMAPEAGKPESKSFIARFAGVFYAPGETFNDIVRSPDFLAPLITMTVLSIALAETMLAKIGMARMIRQTLEQSGQTEKMSAEQLQQAIDRGSQIGTIIAHIGGVVGVPIFVLLIAAVGLLFTNAFFGAQVRFKTSFAVASHAYLISGLGIVMGMAMIFLSDPEHFNAQVPVPTNPAYFLDPREVSKLLFAVAKSFDILTFWLMILLGIGYSEATGRKVKALTMFLCFFGIWLVIFLGRVGFALLS